MNRRDHSQRGFAAISAIFLLVVLAALGGFMWTLSSSQQLSAAQDVQGSRAYWAARAGLEWALAAVAATAPVAPAELPLATCPVTPAPANVEGFALVITCTPQLYAEGAGVPKMIFHLKATAASAGAVGSVGHVERSVSATMER